MDLVQRILFPARAGMNRWNLSKTNMSMSVPRTRGDEPEWNLVGEFGKDCSPHARG